MAQQKHTQNTILHIHTHRQTVGVGHINSILSWSGPQSLHHTKEIQYWLLWIWGCHSGELRLLTMVGVVMSVPVSIYICMCNVARLVIAFICVPHSFLAVGIMYIYRYLVPHTANAAKSTWDHWCRYRPCEAYRASIGAWKPCQKPCVCACVCVCALMCCLYI